MIFCKKDIGPSTNMQDYRVGCESANNTHKPWKICQKNKWGRGVLIWDLRVMHANIKLQYIRLFMSIGHCPEYEVLVEVLPQFDILDKKCKPLLIVSCNKTFHIKN